MVLNELRRQADAAGLDPVIGGSAAAGQVHAALAADEDPASIAALVSGLRDTLGAHGRMRNGSSGGPPANASVVVQHSPAAVTALDDLYGRVPSLALMRSVKAEFDPGRMMAPGRFAGGI